ncbi:hypothetical protein AKJ09_01110 [Labilithrix luteola]|uniref:Saccharopine dehydrogenase NADP binding domain-containing protein n=1 Tax=Labilithrix luteola TaxID=1391654 RepID=A0A0K1PM24_9BACT|nr:saccharopine dehydrogenase NADP-binding domain-containing protein [Labilithrix luteola]AKU94446.1 hypothetical protein AKJ09_01110 [Labilithrix luteola]
MTKRDFDVVLFGATGFTGQLVAEYLARAPTRSRLRWALAGRNEAKLESVRKRLAALEPALADLPIFLADAMDQASLDALVPRTSVIISTVGPFAKYGRKLVSACATHGTHYCDITGEVTFIRTSIDDNEANAEASGARIVHACGFDSIPFDLGVFMLWERALTEGRNLAWAKGFATKVKGGMSGGTIASMVALMDEASHDRAVRRLLGNPYALDPDPNRPRNGVRDQHGVRFDRDLHAWTAPFVMSAINTRVVRRSAVLLGYGAGFRYDESMSFPSGPKGLAMATAMTAGLAGIMVAASNGTTRGLLSKKVLPKPGEGPTKEQRERGSFEVRVLGETTAKDGAPALRLASKVAGNADPGYTETAKMLGESALCLLEDTAQLPKRSGVLTPASAMGSLLVSRLQRAGLTLTVEAR